MGPYSNTHWVEVPSGLTLAWSCAPEFVIEVADPVTTVGVLAAQAAAASNSNETANDTSTIFRISSPSA